MCRSYTVSYTNCGHEISYPELCGSAQEHIPVVPCQGWNNGLRDTFQAADRDCPACHIRNTRRVAQEPWTNRNLGEDVPIRLRRDSLAQRYVPTPPPVYTSRYQYGPGYGSAYGYGDGGRRPGDPDPSQREAHRRVADWAQHVPPATHISNPASSRRGSESYRPRERGHSRSAESRSPRRSASASGADSRATWSRRRSNIYDPRSERHPHPRTEVSGHSSHYLRSSHQESGRRYGYPPSLPPAPDTSFQLSQTTTYIDEDGARVTERNTWTSVDTHHTGYTEEQNRSTGASHAASSHRGSSSHSEGGRRIFYPYP